MNKPLKLKFYSDPGHGWLAVKAKLVDDLELMGEISPYSYMRGKTLYLEEDSDAGKVLKALKAQGMPVEIVNLCCDKSSPIRSYERFDPFLAFLAISNLNTK
jgi:hypothetical protein